MSKDPRATPGRASAVSRFPRFRTEIISPGRTHMNREQPRAPPQNDQNDEALLKKILPGAVTVLGAMF